MTQVKMRRQGGTMRAEALIFGGLLSLTLVLAWGVWKGEAPSTQDKVLLFDPPKARGVTTLRWSDGVSEVAVTAPPGEGERREAWVSTRAPEAPVLPAGHSEGDGHDHGHDGHDEEAAPPAPGAAVVSRQFAGNVQARRLLTDYGPMWALRRFDGLSETARAEMGLVAPKEWVEVASGDQHARFLVGETAYGSDNIYLKAAEGDAVFLVAAGLLRPLRKADKSLMERDPVAVDLAEAVEIEVSTGGKERRLVHQGRHDKANAWWAPAETPEARDATYDGLIDGLTRLQLSGWRADGEGLGEVREVARFVVRDEASLGEPASVPSGVDDAQFGAWASDHPAPHVVLLGQADDGAGGAVWYVRSQRTRAWQPVASAAGADLASAATAVVEK